MEQAADKMFSSTADFLRTEVNAVVDDFQQLKAMHKAVLHKYEDLKKTTQVIGGALEAPEDQYKDLAPILTQLDDIEEDVSNLEQAAFKLDSDCKQLEQKLRSLESIVVSRP
ncbi:biogenesis of lysosome-related organelles complex 1 subunit 2-like [Galendromus occidentalis]|uniref:Biogenesis of lysosome-related organelles complex 1 subunit 2-like n=1 Tax=Galendromus occidentalis TaxID=34638 RepID=A0AAJ6VUW0_9ACAR|nr:biogenesis of lysosome-related organelles complex 1 subunit 2-like [Galendromus occidentalis]